VKPVLSLNDFAWKLRVPLARLQEIADDVVPHYRLKVLKKGDKARHLYVPELELKRLLRRIKKIILDPLPLEAAAHGGVRGKSPRTNAECHLAKRCLVTVDVKQFFPQVRHSVVYRMFRTEFGFGRDVARLITRLTTYRAELPQGSPTSTAIANLLLTMPLDRVIATAAQQRKVDYSRYVDDTAMSGDNPRPLINDVARQLSSRGLRIHRPNTREPKKSKLRIMPGTGPQKITGLNVNSPTGPSVPRASRDNIRAAIHALPTLSPAETQKALRSIQGRIQHVARLNPGAGERLKRYLQSRIDERAEMTASSTLDKCTAGERADSHTT
jgi:RNA-directed DNA polymerase